VLHRIRAACTQRHVVFDRATLVAASVDHETTTAVIDVFISCLASFLLKPVLHSWPPLRLSRRGAVFAVRRKIVSQRRISCVHGVP
jgi:hypothetical protein